MKTWTVLSLAGLGVLAAIALAQPPDGPPEHRGRGPFGMREQSPFENPARAKDAAEEKILKVLDEIQRTQGRRMNVPTCDGRLLRLLAEAIDAKSVVEIGTSNGVSSIWIALALKKTGGKLVTHEIDPKAAALARENFAKAGVADILTVVEGDAHETVSKLKGPIDMVFIDADKEGYSDYLKKILPLVRPGGVVFAHNITPHMADPEYVKAITTNPSLDTAFFMEGAGMSVTMKKR
jgi:predicted O-methyltransferase YrrM